MPILEWTDEPFNMFYKIIWLFKYSLPWNFSKRKDIVRCQNLYSTFSCILWCGKPFLSLLEMPLFSCDIKPSRFFVLSEHSFSGGTGFSCLSCPKCKPSHKAQSSVFVSLAHSSRRPAISTPDNPPKLQPPFQTTGKICYMNSLPVAQNENKHIIITFSLTSKINLSLLCSSLSKGHNHSSSHSLWGVFGINLSFLSLIFWISVTHQIIQNITKISLVSGLSFIKL